MNPPYFFGIELPFEQGSQVWFAYTNYGGFRREHDIGKCPLCKKGRIKVKGNKAPCPNKTCRGGRIIILLWDDKPWHGRVNSLSLHLNVGSEPGKYCVVGIIFEDEARARYLKEMHDGVGELETEFEANKQHTKVFLTKAEAQALCDESSKAQWDRALEGLEFPPKKVKKP